MKKIIFTIASIFLACTIYAQTSGGPDLYGYTWKNSSHTVAPPSYSWFDITTIGTQVTGLADDNYVGPFSCTGFQYYWTPETQFWIGSNGFISFTPQNIASPFPASIPLSTGGNYYIAPLLGDLNFTGTGNTAQCYYYANTDTICVSFINVPFWTNNSAGYTGNNSFQIILNKVDKSITFNYLSTSLGTVTTLDNIVGIENNTGNLGLSSLIDVLPTSTSTIKFYYPSTVTYAVTDGGMEWNDNVDNAAIFIESQGDSLQLIASVKNFGNQALNSFSVHDTIYSSSGTVVQTGIASSSALAQGVSDTVYFTNKFKAPSAGTYRFNSAITGITGDMVASNNRIQQEIIAINTNTKNMTLDYSDGTSNGDLGWNGGNGGVGIYVKPPVYPVRITGSRFNIADTDSGNVGFHAIIYDDDGVNGGPGTMLDSVYVDPSTITLDVYTIVPTSNTNLMITSGGVYILWLMDSAEIRINTDNTPPISRRTFEVLSGGWAGYRSMLTEDFLMGLDIENPAPIAGYRVEWSQEPRLRFRDTSEYGNSRHWNFGDGGTSGWKNPWHVFEYNGTYSVCLTSTSVGGSDSVCKSITITKCPPVSKFTYDDSNAPTIVFSDSSVHNPNAWQWDLDDAGAVSALQDPTYTFTTNGYHNVCLTAINQYGQGSTYCDSILITNVGINDIDKEFNSLTAYPNPFTEQTTIEFNTTSTRADIQLKCFDVLGKMQEISYTLNNNSIILNKANLANGSYYLEVYNGNVLIGKLKVMVL